MKIWKSGHKLRQGYKLVRLSYTRLNLVPSLNNIDFHIGIKDIRSWHNGFAFEFFWITGITDRQGHSRRISLIRDRVFR